MFHLNLSTTQAKQNRSCIVCIGFITVQIGYIIAPMLTNIDLKVCFAEVKIINVVNSDTDYIGIFL